MTAPTMTDADVDLARFLAEVAFEAKESPWRFHPLTVPVDEIERREYEHETERLRRFIRGQHTNTKESNA